MTSCQKLCKSEDSGVLGRVLVNLEFYAAENIFQHKREMRTFLDKRKPKEFVGRKPELPEMLKEAFQEQERQY